ncbi:MAG: YcjX family protein, partial [Hyphomicrobium sp.]
MSDLLKGARTRIADYLTPAVRLGVTGLSRSGKTVFITALVRNLTGGGRLPFFTPDAEGRILRAYLEPQPDDAVPRFDYEAHMASLEGEPSRWPESTRRVSELRVTIEYQSANRLKRMLGLSKLHLDIVD